jgi:hypothetical protein
MKVGWILDSEMFSEYRDELMASIRAQGHELRLVRVPSPPYRWDDVGCSYRDAFAKDSCVIALGDIELVTRIGRERRWEPGVFATIEHFACSNYFCHFGEYLLNHTYAMVPFGELRRLKEFLFGTFGQDGRIFVRPDSPLKLFTGQIVTADKFEADLDFMGFYGFPPESLVVVSAPQSIEVEWRFVVANRSIVAGTQYKQNGKNLSAPTFEPSAKELAAQIADSPYQPDPVYVVDICRTSAGEYRMLEIGGFSFSDLYATDKNAVVEAVSEAAVAQWKRLQGR